MHIIGVYTRVTCTMNRYYRLIPDRNMIRNSAKKKSDWKRICVWQLCLSFGLLTASDYNIVIGVDRCWSSPR